MKPKKEKKLKKVPAARKKPTEFKKGKWNPNIELVELERCKEGPSDRPAFACCVRCNNKELIRAANTHNKHLLRACLDANRHISSLSAYWSPEVAKTALEVMIRNNDHEMLELFLHPELRVLAHSNYDATRSGYYSNRVGNPEYLLRYVDTGMVSQMAYGTRVRKV